MFRIFTPLSCGFTKKLRAADVARILVQYRVEYIAPQAIFFETGFINQWNPFRKCIGMYFFAGGAINVA